MQIAILITGKSSSCNREDPVLHTALQKGFTLLELLIVCLLISISLGLSIPSIRSSLITDELASGSRKVISLIKSCRAKAMSDQKPYLIFYDSADHTLWYRQADQKEKQELTARSSITLPDSVRIRQIQQATGSDDKSPAKEGIWISGQGYIDKTAIYLSDSGNNTLSLLISPFLPTIKVVEGSIDFE